jgi:glycosyltransferase involved in cell wall biosynthesis
MEVTYMAASERYQVRSQAEAQKFVEARFGVKGPFILSVGAFEPRKNLTRVVEAFGLVADRIPHNLVIVGPAGWKNEKILEKLTASKVRERIHHVGYVSAEELPQLYSAADVFIFASIYEGFGIPALEAMASGTPVISSNASSLPEVVGNAARLVDPFSIEDIGSAIVEVSMDESKKKKMKEASLEQARKFSWDRTAQQMIRIFDSLAHSS